MGVYGWIKDRVTKRSFNLRDTAMFNYTAFVNDESILRSSDTYSLMKLISDQVALSDFVVEDTTTGKVSSSPQALHALRVLNRPNDYLTGFEFKKLLTNTYLLEGDVYPFYDGKQIHVLSGAVSELTAAGTERITCYGSDIPPYMVRHIKNMGLNHADGVGLLELARETLEGVMNAEKAITEKYKKGGLIAFLLKLDTHLYAAANNNLQQVEEILDQLEDINTTHKTKMIPLGKGYDIKALESPIDDEKILKYLNVYKKDLGKYFGLDAELLEEIEKKDMEQAMMMLFTNCLKPIFKNFEEHLSQLFFPTDSNLRIRFRYNVLDYVSFKTKTDIGYNLVRTMIATPDDAREMLGFPRLETPESSKLYVSKDLVGIDKLDEASKGGDASGENGATDV
ncbi:MULTISPECIES: phage portal protein [Bacillus subtilis group]|uniref:phage portal protein n=2 Tax=Bacillus TaxID=1386 RepID=UPI0013771315|nr:MULTISPECIES: phage portal protein [Bacillus subtilis group]KAF1340193.1 hypothetical protein ABP1_0806 [Bacillus subtilis]MEC5258490.1 phage portal protein [Bacillus amyloliquefaciens]